MAKGVKIAKITENDSQEQRISKLNSNFQNLLAAAMKLDKLGVLSNRNKKQIDEAAADAAAAQKAADSAQQSANDAQTAADTAKANAATAQSTADTAKANAATAQSTANTAKANAATAQSAADAAQEAADKAQGDVDSLATKVTAAETKITQNAEAITLRATKTEVSTAKSEAISTAASDATSKANSAKEAAINAAATDATNKADAAEAAAKQDTANKLKDYSTTVQMNSAIQQKADSITSTVAETYQPKGDYVTGTSAYSQLKQTVSGINSTVQSHTGSISTLQQTAEGIKVRLENQQTVRNLVSKSRRLDGWGNVVSAGVTLSKNVSTSAPEFGEVTVAQFNASTSNASAQSSYIHMTNAARVTSGKKYTFSMWARKVSGGNARPRFSISLTNSQSAVIPENLTTEWKRYSYTFTLGTIATSGNRGDITTSFGISVLANQTGVFEICCPQLEAGETMNPWSANSFDATDYMSFTEDGLVIGDMTEDGLGNNVIIDSDSVDIRNGSEVLATFGEYARVGKVNGGNVTVTSDNISLKGKTANVSNAFDAVQILSKEKQYENGTYKGYGSIKLLESDGDYGSIWKQDSGVNIQIGESATGATILSVDDGSDASYKPGLYVGYRNIEDNVPFHWILKAISGDVARLYSPNGNSIGVGVGSGGINRGIYDYVFDKWVLYCNETDLYIASSRGNAFKPYYTAGDTITLDRLNTAGFVTSSKTKVYFSFNPGKPLYGVSLISCSSIDGLALRQDGAYTHGSSSSSLVKPSSYLTSAVGNSIGICATFTNTTNAINNAPIGVAASIKITFS